MTGNLALHSLVITVKMKMPLPEIGCAEEDGEEALQQLLLRQGGRNEMKVKYYLFNETMR